MVWRKGDPSGNDRYTRLMGYRVAVSPGGPALDLLIRGFQSDGELEAFVLKLRGLGLLSLATPVEEIIEANGDGPE